MMRKSILIIFTVMMFSTSLFALEIADVQIPETIKQADGTELVLNGAGVRSKFIFKVYIAQLYVKEKSKDPAALIAPDTGKRMAMHFLYSEVDKESLVDAWNSGFKGNGTKEQLESLKAQIEAFNAMFDTVKEGDVIILDYVPGKGTSVVIRDQEKGLIPGKPFNDLLLSIWLGKKPVTETLRDDLLGK